MFEGIRKGRRDLLEISVVPILDMWTGVIFFMLLSTAFVELTKLTLPPSSVSQVARTSRVIPTNPKLFLDLRGKELQVLITWSGSDPGSDRTTLHVPQGPKYPVALKNQIRRMVEGFVRKFPAEKTLQIGLGPEVSYQILIAVMDGAQVIMPDVVLISYQEAVARLSGV